MQRQQPETRRRPQGAWILLLVALLWPAVPAPLRAASDLARFNAAVAESYAPYRSALFYLRTGNPAVANLEIQEALERWRATVLPFGAAPPDAYADDPAFDAVLEEVAVHLQKAEALSASGAVEPAGRELEPVRERLGALRARNGQRVFSDCVDDANAAMDRLWEFRDATLDFADRAQVNALRHAASITLFLYRRCREQAPDALAGEAEFGRIVGGAIASLETLPEAIDEADAERVVNLLRELRSFDRLFWLNFG